MNFYIWSEGSFKDGVTCNHNHGEEIRVVTGRIGSVKNYIKEALDNGYEIVRHSPEDPEGINKKLLNDAASAILDGIESEWKSKRQPPATP